MPVELDPEIRGAVEIQLKHIDTLIPYANNARTHSPEQISQIASSIEEFGFTNPLIADEQGVVAGHGRLLAVRQLLAAGRPIRTPAGVALPEGHVPVIDCSGWSEPKRRAYIIADNQLALNAGWDAELLKLELGELRGVDYDLHVTGFSTDFLAELGFGAISDGHAGRPSGAGSLAERFGIPPFSVLNAREGWWQARKSAWLALGIRSEIGRGGASINDAAPGGAALPNERAKAQNLTWATGGGGDDTSRKNLAAGRKPNASPGGSPLEAANYSQSGARGDGRARAAAGAIPGGGTGPNSAWKFRGDDGYKTQAERNAPGGAVVIGHLAESEPGGDGAARSVSGTSIFDPVLCELAYRWFCPPGGLVLDPFAGGSVRGIVAAKLGRRYQGHELRAEQVEANRFQGVELCADAPPLWIEGDSRETIPASDAEADLVFSCPPYGDLEVYSDDEADLSAMAHAEFLVAYREIIAAAVAKLKEDRFACFVVGEFRDKAGKLRSFVPDTIAAFEAAGAAFYNDAILVTAVGSLPIRAGKQFSSTRKLGRTHQYVLVFVKGDPAKAAAAVGECDFGELAPEGAEEAGADAPAPFDASATPVLA